MFDAVGHINSCDTKAAKAPALTCSCLPAAGRGAGEHVIERPRLPWLRGDVQWAEGATTTQLVTCAA
jgi:hypothetical protein